MRIIAFIVLFLAAAGSPLRADFRSPFADDEVGSTVTSHGEILVEARPGEAPAYFVRFGTDTGARTFPAEIPAELIRHVHPGERVKITATIREREEPKTKAKARFLEVLQIESSR